jgi:hypothetical protein
MELDWIWLQPEGRHFELKDWVLWETTTHTLIRHFGPSSPFVVPAEIANLGPFCFAGCMQLLELEIETGCSLSRIEGCAFVQSTLTSLHVPNTINFIDGSALVHLQSLSLEDGNPNFTIDGQNLFAGRALIRCFNSSSHVRVGNQVEVLGKFSFAMCESLTSLEFEADSHLLRI